MPGRDYVALARAYEDEVRSGTIPACKWVRLACERNARDREQERTDGFPFWFDAEAAVAICAATELFPHIKGPKAKPIGRDEDGQTIWQTIQLEPWQCWILTTLFGWKRVDNNLRRFRTGFILVPRKNAKSTLAAAVLLFMLGPDGEMGAECYSAATTRPQAAVVSGMAYAMAQRTPSYREFFGVKLGARTSKKLEIPELESFAEPLSADAETLDGLNVHFSAVDELHAHRTRDVWDVLDTATGARDQPLLLPITTAGVNTGGICYELLSYLQRILEQVLTDETFFGINYTIDEGDAWDDPAVQRKANPNYGVSVRPDDLERKTKRAQASKAALNNFKTKHLNIWVKADTTWMSMDAWHACGRRLRLEDLSRFPCWIGVDLAEVQDVAAVIALFKLGPDRYAVVPRLYLPEDTVERSPVAQYSGWVQDGHLIQTDGNIADYLRIEEDIHAWCTQQLNVQAVCFDRALAAMMMQSLQLKLGGTPEILVVNQNLETMNPAMQALERFVLGGTFEHDSNPVMTWMASNVVIQKNFKDEIYPRKAGGKDSPNKIDGIVALLTALSVAEKSDGAGATAYDDDGIFTV